MVGYEWHDLVGNVGVICILTTYLGLQMEKIAADSISYCLLNALGAGLVIVSLMFEFNLSAFVIEGAWLLISLFGLGRHLLKTA